MNILKGYFDGFEFTRYCVINSVQPSITAPQTNSFHVNNLVSGGRFYYSKLGQIVLDIDITIVKNVMYNLERLNMLLYSTEPKELWFSNRPDRYIMAIMDGEVKLNSSYVAGKAKLRMISPNYYWRDMQGYTKTQFDGQYGVVENKGTAPTKPIFDVKFKSDCGYISLVGPNGFLALGNPKQEDTIQLPSTEVALQDEFTTSSLSNWTKITNAETWIPDYIKMSSAGTGKADSVGMVMNAPGSKTYYWNGHAVTKEFEAGAIGIEADNFDLSSKVAMSNAGDLNNTCALLMVVMDANNVPIMSTSVYDINSGKNELTVTFKVPTSSGAKTSKIIHTGKLSALDGRIRMVKKGNSLSWEVYSDKTVVTTGQTLRVGMKVHISKSCTHAETGHPIKRGYHDLTYVIGGVKTGKDGSKAYRLDHGGWPIYWIYERDIKEARNTSISRVPSSVKYSIIDNQLAQLKATKVFIWQAKWHTTAPYSQFVVDNILVKRTHDVAELDIKNVFTTDDHLYINTETNEVLLNGANASGLLDVDSRFFSIDGGPTQLAIDYSEWAKLPEVTVTHESRWLS